MSFHEDLIPLFKRDLAAVLAVVPDAIYVGDQPQKITRQGLEVWVEPGAGGVAQVGALKVHPYVLHVRLKTRRGPSLTGADEIARVRSALETLQARYDGARPFVADLPLLLAVQAEGSSVETDPESGALDGSLQLKLLEA
ncbi:MAG TPA: hypothetical protein DEA08_29725 [Planctomycetes bacterium]|nr:hypothetical protein [Planctomycetota bacterium]